MNLSVIKKRFFYLKHPDTALRYLPILDILRQSDLENSSILEVGSGSIGIAPYLKKPLVGLDVSFPSPAHPLIRQKKGSALKLPFPKSSFAVVILSDILEHLPKSQRAKAIREAVRVCSSLLIISGPTGDLSFSQDQALAPLSNHPFFKEHLQYGLPQVIDLVHLLKNEPKVSHVFPIRHTLNLTVRYYLMRLYLAGRVGYYIYLKPMMLLVPLLRLLNFPPCYRAIITARVSP